MCFRKLICGIMTITILCSSLIDSIPVYGQEKHLPSGIPYENIPQVIEEYIREHEARTTAVSIALFDDKETIYQTTYGYTNIHDQTPVNEHTVYEWGSVSKLLIWISIMQLYEQGQIDLLEDIKTYLPNNFLTKLKFNTRITVMDLMNHTGGWQETTFDIETGNATDIVSLEQALKQTEPPQLYEPGSICAYSNWGTALAGLIVERISGQTFYSYVHEQIFSPLGMEHTGLAPDLSDNFWVQQERYKQNSYYDEHGTIRDLGPSIRHILLYPAGMVTGTLEDFLTFAKSLLPSKSGANKLFSNTDTLTRMYTPTAYFGNTDIPRNAHGMWAGQYQSTTYGHAGNTRGYSANLVIDPISLIGIVVMTNQKAEVIYNSQLMPFIFGEYNPSASNGVLPSTAHVSGIYTASRTLKTGLFKILNVIGSPLPLVKTSDENTLKLAIGPTTFTQVAPNQYISDSESGSFLVYADDRGKEIKLQMTHQDFIKENTMLFFAKLGFIIMAVLSILYAAFMLLIEGILFVINLFKKKKRLPYEMRKYQILAQSAMVICGLFFILIYNSSSITPATLWYKCTTLGLLGLMLLGYPLLFIKKYKYVPMSKGKLINGIITVIGGLMLSANIFFWNLYNFWV